MTQKNKACVRCRESGHDSTGNHLWLMRDGSRYTCNKKEYHSDGQVYYEDVDGNPISDLFSKLSPSEPACVPGAPIVHIWSPLLADYRGIPSSVYYKYGTEGSYAPDGSLQALGHMLKDSSGKDIARKVRKLPKDFFIEGTTKGHKVSLFGQSVFPRAKRLLITEGEIDAMSAYAMLSVYKVACVSLPLGANIKALADNISYLKGFKEVYICVDQDEAGEAVARDIANLIPRSKFLKISEKDANAMLLEGKQAEFISAFWDADVYKPESIVRVEDVLKKVLERPTIGTPWPWPTLTEKTYGRNPGQGMYVGAAVKCGKSEWINELVAFDIQAKRKVAILKYEEPPAMTVKRIAGKLDGIAYHRPGVMYLDADLERTARSMQDYLYMYPAFGKVDWESTKDFIRYAAVSGSKTIIIDPLTRLSNGLTPSDTETLLRKIADELSCMAQDLGFYYIVTCHLKAPTSGPSHERGGRVNSADFRGSRAMMEATYYMLGIERNKDPELPEDERNTSTFVLLEDRNFGNTCSFKVKYDPVTQAYREPILSF